MDRQISNLIGSCALLFFAVHYLSQRSKSMSEGKFRQWINRFTKNAISSTGLGFLLGLLTGSNNAVSVPLFHLVDAGYISVRAALGLSIAAGFGATALVHVISLNVFDIGPLLLIAGTIAETLTFGQKRVSQMRVLLPIGLVLFSSSVVSRSVQGMEFPFLAAFVERSDAGWPILVFLGGFLLSTAFQSTTATLALAFAFLSTTGSTTFPILALVGGTNLGSVSTFVRIGLNSRYPGRRFALALFYLRVLPSAIFLTACYVDLPYAFSGWLSMSQHMAMCHSLFHAVSLILCVMFGRELLAGVNRQVPERIGEVPFEFAFIRNEGPTHVKKSLQDAGKEVTRISRQVEEMFDKTLPLFKTCSDAAIEKIRSRDKSIDFLNKGVRFYLAAIPAEKLSADLIRKQLELIIRSNDLENIGDTIDKNILGLALKLRNKGYVFSNMGWQEISSLHRKVLDCLRQSSVYFEHRDVALGKRLLKNYRDIELMTVDLIEAHIARLQQQVTESQMSSSIHIDMIGLLNRIAFLSVHFILLDEARQSQVLIDHAG